jgi:hypothetical protein
MVSLIPDLRRESGPRLISFGSDLVHCLIRGCASSLRPATAVFVPPFMRPKSDKRNAKSRNASRSHEQNDSAPAGLRRLSAVLEEYGAAAEEGAVEKVSRLAEEIIEIIAQNRKRTVIRGYYHRPIE